MGIQDETAIAGIPASANVRECIVNVFRRDLVGPDLHDADLATERLSENPSRWYLLGFLAPAEDPLVLDSPNAAEDDPSGGVGDRSR